MRDADGVVYFYDGSFAGFLSCIFEIYAQKRPPLEIRRLGQESLFDCVTVETDPQKARRVYDGFGKKAGAQAQRLARCAFRASIPQKEMRLYRFIALGFKRGKAVMEAWNEETVGAVRQAVRQVEQEAERIMGFARLRDSHGVLTGVIEPEHQVLPLLAEHFAGRYREQVFLLYDKRHKEALVYKPFQYRIVPMEEFEPPQADWEEAQAQWMWKKYFEVLSVETRQNLRQQRQMMPKKYWKHMTELKPEVYFEKRQSALQGRQVAKERLL